MRRQLLTRAAAAIWLVGVPSMFLGMEIEGARPPFWAAVAWAAGTLAMARR